MSQQAIDNIDVAAFWKKGYQVLPGVYTQDEIKAFRDASYASKGEGGDLLASPRLRSVLTDGRMVEVSRRLLGTDDIVYGGDSAVTINGTQRGWHKDNTDRLDGDAPDWQSSYTQLRFGIYCQDHSKHTGGLNLRERSHDIKNLTAGPLRYITARPGDLAVWSMRITHSGNGMLLRWPWRDTVVGPYDQDKVPAWKVAKAKEDRIAIFAHLGANDEHAQRYLDYLKTRTYMVEAWRQRPYDDEARRAAEAAGITLRDLPAEVMDDPNAGLNPDWEPFPY